MPGVSQSRAEAGHEKQGPAWIKLRPGMDRAGAMAGRTGGAQQQPRWQALRFFNLYRLVIAGLLCMLGWQGELLGEIDARQPVLTLIIGATYVGLTVIAQGLIEARRWSLPRLTILLALLDTLALASIMYASGGVASGLGMLMVVALAGACLLSEGEVAALLAAMTTAALLIQEVSLWLLHPQVETHFTQAGLLGAGCFATAMLAQGLRHRVRESEALAERRGIDLANLERLNGYIVERLQSGILVIDASGGLRLANEAALAMTGIIGWQDGERLQECLPLIAELRTAWLGNGRQPSQTLRLPGAETEVLVSFTAVGPDNSTDTLVFLEDASSMRQRAQGLKLASLGRLTASIAHEVRNPLGAISYAAQLLAESAALGAEDRRLTGIIHEQSHRVNRIIENVLSIGRRSAAIPNSFVLQVWLAGFVLELRERYRLGPEAVLMEVPEPPVVVRMDASQLQQVLWNLSENALRYSRREPRLRLLVATTGRLQRPCLDIHDTGPGIAEGDREHIFEPFFTREAQGTGLGLYLARELCEANQAELQLLASGPEGSCFRLQFAHPGRLQREAAL